MSDGNTRSSGPDAPQGVSPDDHLPTTRLPPISAPPVHGRSGRPASLPPSAAADSTVEGDREQPRPRAKAPIRASFSWKLLAVSLFGRGVLDERSVRRRIGAVSLVLGFVLAIGGLVLGLRGAPLNTSLAPVVTASLVVARALAGLGMLILGLALFRLGERLLLGDG